MTPAFLNLLRQHVSAEGYRQLPPDDLWAKVRADLDEGAFRVLLERIGSRIYQRCRSILGDDHLAEEAFQNTFLDLVRRRATIPGYRQAAAWAYQAATNHSRHLRRKQRRWQSGAAVEPAAVPPDPPDAEAVARLLAVLPDRYRRPLELVFWDGLSHAEAAVALGWSKGKVSSYVARGLKRLKAAAGKLGLPAVGAIGVEVALARPATAVSGELVTAAVRTVWTSAGPAPLPAWGAFGWARVAAPLATVGVAAGVWWGTSAPPPSPAAPVPVAAAVESVPDRNLRVFRDAVLPTAVAALRDLPPEFGAVTLASVDAFDTRVDCTFELRDRGSARVPPSRLRFVHQTRDGSTRILFDMFGRGRPKPLNPERALVLGRIPFTATEWVVPSDPVRRAVTAFAVLPRDDRTGAEAAAHRDRLRAAVARHLGVWYRRGDPAGWCVIGLEDGGPVLRTAAAEAGGEDGLRVGPDGLPRGVFLLGGDAVFAADGRRIDFPPAADWWVRGPAGVADVRSAVVARNGSVWALHRNGDVRVNGRTFWDGMVAFWFDAEDHVYLRNTNGLLMRSRRPYAKGGWDRVSD